MSNFIIIAGIQHKFKVALFMAETNFKSERISKEASITLNGNIKDVFPLFNAFEERKWAHGWDLDLIYPETGVLEEGTTFKTTGNGIDDSEFLWIVSKFQPDNYLIQYLVSTVNRFWTITVTCSPAGDKTNAEIMYEFTGLNDKGNEFNRLSLDKMYAHELKDWQEAINYYLAHGKMLTH